MKHPLPSLLLALAFVLLAPLASWLDGSLLLAAAFTLVVLGLFALVARAWVDLGIVALAGVLLAAVTFSHALGANEAVVLLRWGSITGFLFLNLTLLIGPWARFTRRAVPLLRARRYVGVATFLLAMLHVSGVTRLYLENDPAAFFQRPFLFFGFTGYFLLTALALTSWDLFQHRLGRRWWMALHALLFVGYLGAAARFLTQASAPIAAWQMFLLLGFVVAWFLLAPWGLAPRIVRNMSMWKQLHRLIWIAYVAVVAHAWMGPVGVQAAPWMQWAFWLLVLFTVGSHAVGLMRQRRQRAA